MSDFMPCVSDILLLPKQNGPFQNETAVGKS